MTIFAVCFSSFALTSCGDDDDDEYVYTIRICPYKNTSKYWIERDGEEMCTYYDNHDSIEARLIGEENVNFKGSKGILFHKNDIPKDDIVIGKEIKIKIIDFESIDVEKLFGWNVVFERPDYTPRYFCKIKKLK